MLAIGPVRAAVKDTPVSGIFPAFHPTFLALRTGHVAFRRPPEHGDVVFAVDQFRNERGRGAALGQQVRLPARTGQRDIEQTPLLGIGMRLGRRHHQVEQRVVRDLDRKAVFAGAQPKHHGNRLLALPIAEQNQLFAELEERIAANIEQAIEAGSYEVGVETVIADSLAIAGRETLYEHPGTGAATELVEIVRRDRLEPLAADAALEIGKRDPGRDGEPRLVFNTRSQRAAVVLPAPSRMFDDGGVQERIRLLRPATRETMAKAEFDASNWRKTDAGHWRMLWKHEIGELPSHRESRFWLACGLLLPVWDRLPAENMRVRRLTSDPGSGPGQVPGSGEPAPAHEPGGQATGESLIGRVLDAEQVRDVRASFGLDGGPAMSGAEAFDAVMERGNALALANGWRLARRRLMGANRVEIQGPADTDLPALRRMGCTVEIVSFRARIFAPNAEVIERLLDRWPLAA